MVLSANYGAFEGQLTGDYIGKRYATYINDQSVGSTFVMGMEASYTMKQAFWDMRPKELASAPCQEVVWNGGDVDSLILAYRVKLPPP